jgi:SPP1 family predicted phage head-tail adaptor
MAVSAGELDRRITIQAATESRDDAGDVILTWSDDFDLWASKKDQRGFETVSGQQLIRTADTVFEIRRSTRALTITPEKHRVAFQGKLYSIVSVQEGRARDESLQLLTSSRPDGQGARGRDQVTGP